MHRLQPTLFLLLTITCSAIAQQARSTASSGPVPPPPPQWQRVTSLQLGEPIAVLERGRSYPLHCRMDDADDVSLTCITAPAYAAPRRVVLPIGSIAAVYHEEIAQGTSQRGLLIGTSIGAALGGLACRQGNARTIFACIGVGGLIGLSVAAAPSPYPVPPRTHLRLLYRAP